MNIKELTQHQISDKIREYLPLFMQKHNEGENLFQEAYILDFDEISHNLPKKYHKHFNDNDKINNISGTIESTAFDYDYTINLLTDEKSEKAYFLLLQKNYKSSMDDAEIELLKCFLDADGSKLTVPQLTRYNSTIHTIQKSIELGMDRLTTKGADNDFQNLLDDMLWQTIAILADIKY